MGRGRAGARFRFPGIREGGISLNFAVVGEWGLQGKLQVRTSPCELRRRPRQDRQLPMECCGQSLLDGGGGEVQVAGKRSLGDGGFGSGQGVKRMKEAPRPRIADRPAGKFLQRMSVSLPTSPLLHSEAHVAMNSKALTFT